MRPRRFHSANRVYRLEGASEDHDLWVEVLVADDANLGQVPAIRSVWQLDDKDRERIANGANVELCLVGATQQPPVEVSVTDEPLGKRP